ncbi:MAG TPA: hypothetical protein VEI01_17925 [Terriglobales bacterium]|nr:hypothetical protein [Terriglobales bacterium]
MQETLRRLQEDRPLLEVRVAELSEERQNQAKRFAASVIEQTEAELSRLLEERPIEEPEVPCEPAD